MDRRQHIEQLEEELRQCGADFMVDDGFDAEMRESFLEYVLEFETAERKPLLAWLADSGCEAGGGIHQLLEDLAFLSIAVEFADHLNDEELYARLTV